MRFLLFGQAIPPTLSSASPSMGATTGGTQVTVSGAHIVPILTGSTLTLGGVAMTITGITSTTITFTTPTSHTGTSAALDIVYTPPGGSPVTLAAAFTYAAPTVGTPSPRKVSPGGGVFVKIVGTNFGQNPTVSIGGTPVNAAYVTWISEQEIDISSAPAGSGAEDVTVTNTDSVSGTGTGVLIYGSTTAFHTVDFTTASLGGIAAATFTATYGLTLARASVATVQTGASTLNATPGVNAARIGSVGGGWQGLVFEHGSTNYLPNSRVPTSGAGTGWQTGTSSTLTLNAYTSPDGTATSAAHMTCSSGGFGNDAFVNYNGSGSSGVAPPFTMSAWLRGGSGSGPVQFSTSNNTGGTGVGSSASATTAWGRYSVSGSSFTAAFFAPADGRSVFGLTAQALDVGYDYGQHEPGLFATEAIVVTGTTPATRAAEILHEAVAHWDDTDAIVLEFNLRPKSPTQNYASPFRLVTLGNFYAEFDPATGTVTASNGTSSWTSAISTNFSAQDALDLFLSWGDGDVTVGARLNGGNAIVPLSKPLAGSVSTSGGTELYFLSTTTPDRHFDSWIQKIQAYPQGSAPSWFVPPTPTATLVDFTGATAGGQTQSAFRTAYAGMDFTRASAGTVQTGASAIDSTPAVNSPRFVQRGLGANTALLVEESRTNVLKQSRALSTSPWTASGSATMTTGQASVDGSTGATRIQVSGNYSTLQAVTQAAPWVYSAWIKPTSNGGLIQFESFVNTSSPFVSTNGPTPTAWGRYQCAAASGGQSTGNLVSAEGFNRVTGQINAPIDYAYDFGQCEAGNFVTSPIVTTTTTVTRAGDRPFATVPTFYVVGGRASFFVAMRPHGTASQYTEDKRFYTHTNTTTYLEFNHATQVPKVACNGTAASFSSAMGWVNARDLVELFSQSGGGSLGSTLQYRLNSGLVTALIPLAAQPSIPSPVAIDILGNNASNVFSADLEKFGCATPSWAIAIPFTSGAVTRTLVTDGDSITAGFGLSAGQDYPDQAASLLGTGVAVGGSNNVAVSGEALSTMRTNASANVDPLAVSGHTNIVSCFGGTNDIALNSQTGATVYGTWTGYLGDRLAANIGTKPWDGVFMWGMLPRSGVSGFETQRQVFLTDVAAFAPTSWQSSHAYTAGTYVKPTAGAADTTHPELTFWHVFVAQGSFTSGGTEPTWNDSVGGTTSDNGGTWRRALIAILHVDQDAFLGGTLSTNQTWWQSDDVHPNLNGSIRNASRLWNAVALSGL